MLQCGCVFYNQTEKEQKCTIRIKGVLLYNILFFGIIETLFLPFNRPETIRIRIIFSNQVLKPGTWAVTGKILRFK